MRSLTLLMNIFPSNPSFSMGLATMAMYITFKACQQLQTLGVGTKASSSVLKSALGNILIFFLQEVE